MKKKLTRVEERIGSEVEIATHDGMLVVIPESERDRMLRESLQKMDEQYGDVFRRLADS